MSWAPILLAGGLFVAVALWGNDGSANATPAGGVQLTREARISMEKERLTISRDLVTVEYEFLNLADQDITTEVAFPVPDYGIGFHFSAGPADLEGWHVWVEGRELKYETEVRAILKGKDHTTTLRGLSIDVSTFGDWDVDAGSPDIKRLSNMQQRELERIGLAPDGLPAWSVRKTYHWRQTFPAHKTLHIRHEYKPELGLEHLDLANLQGKQKEPYASLADSCVDSPLLKTLIAAIPNDNGFASGSIDPTWVDYILTTANTWKTPIKDFELVIRKPQPKGRERYYISLCWEGKIEQRNRDTFVARAVNFTPKRELRVMFFQAGK